jgi:hypothetical protein
MIALIAISFFPLEQKNLFILLGHNLANSQYKIGSISKSVNNRMNSSIPTASQAKSQTTPNIFEPVLLARASHKSLQDAKIPSLKIILSKTLIASPASLMHSGQRSS